MLKTQVDSWKEANVLIYHTHIHLISLLAVNHHEVAWQSPTVQGGHQYVPDLHIQWKTVSCTDLAFV